MTISIKKFESLTLPELYELLKLRAEVFVVEQECAYLDPDGKDYKAWHVLGYMDGKLAAYTRLFNGGDYFEEAAIGRVVVSNDYRKLGLGNEIMEASIAFLIAEMGEEQICLSAQTYLKRFYKDLGFEEEGDEYPEDGIPHIRMRYKKTGGSAGL